jgi:hypothetical protein
MLETTFFSIVSPGPSNSNRLLLDVTAANPNFVYFETVQIDAEFTNL